MEVFGYQFKDEDLYNRAVTHASAGAENYELLEFFGDKVLSLVISEYLIHKYSYKKEGQIAKKHSYLVSGVVLSEIATNLKISKLINVSDAERKDDGHKKPSILEDCFEAILGAIYLDSCLETVRAIILDIWQDSFAIVDKAIPINPKSKLQEMLQKNAKALPIYKLIKKQGPENRPIITVSLDVEGQDVITTTAHSKKDAEVKLAQEMIEILKANG